MNYCNPDGIRFKLVRKTKVSNISAADSKLATK
jgi:hypothetical protein